MPDARLKELQPLPPGSKARQVGEALSAFIGDSGLKPGDRLPTERALCAALKVGRSSLREAVSQLAARGVLEARIGSGTYVRRAVTADTAYLPLSIETSAMRDSMLMALEVRRGLEIEASIAAAKRRTASDLIAMEAALDEMERRHLAEGASGKADYFFHIAIYDAAHNPLFRQLLEQLRELLHKFFEQPFRPDFAARSFPFHRTLFNAIRDGDPQAAACETRKILDVVEEDIRTMSK